MRLSPETWEILNKKSCANLPRKPALNKLISTMHRLCLLDAEICICGGPSQCPSWSLQRDHLWKMCRGSHSKHPGPLEKDQHLTD